MIGLCQILSPKIGLCQLCCHPPTNSDCTHEAVENTPIPPFLDSDFAMNHFPCWLKEISPSPFPMILSHSGGSEGKNALPVEEKNDMEALDDLMVTSASEPLVSWTPVGPQGPEMDSETGGSF
jgi:hypothetical protein